MINLKNTIVGAIALSTVAIGTANAGSLVLDSFNYDPAISLTVNSTGNIWTDASGPLTNVDSPNNGTLFADLLLQSDNGNPATDANASSFINGASGELSYSNSSGVDSEMSLFYTDITPGAQAVDFTFGGAFSEFYFDVSDIDLNFTATIYVISGLYDPTQFISPPVGSADNSTFDLAYLDSISASAVTLQPTTAIDSTAGDPSERITASFDDLVGDGDIESVTGIFAILSSTSGRFDVTINEIGLTDVPEPTTLALLGLGLLGLGASRRKA